MIDLIKSVFLKEFKELMRDKRTLMTIFFSGVVIGPVILVGLGAFIASLESKVEKRVVYIQDKQYAPDLVNFLQRNGANIKDAPADYEASQKSGQLENAVIVVPKDFQDKLAQGIAPTLVLVFDESRSNAAPQVGLTKRLLRGYVSELASAQLTLAGVSPALAQQIEIQEKDLSSAQAKSGQLLAMVPLFAMIGAVAAALSAAVDLTAGERERGSLEPLMMNPISSLGLAIGKWLAICSLAWLSTALTLLGFYAAINFQQNETLQTLMQFGPKQMLMFLVMIVPFACMMSALLMLVSIYGRSFKEAQTYASYVLMVINLVPLVVVFGQLKDAPWQWFVPSLGQQMAMNRSVRGDSVSWGDILVPGMISFAIAAGLLMIIARLLRNERIIFGRSQ